MLAIGTIQITEAYFFRLVIGCFVDVLVGVMSDVILRSHDLLMLAILGHSRVTPLERQHQHQQNGEEAFHDEANCAREAERTATEKLNSSTGAAFRQE